MRKQIEEYETSDSQNLQKIAKFTKELEIENLSAARICKYLTALRVVDRKLGGKSFDVVTKQDIKDLIAEINTCGYAEWTKVSYKVIIKKFWQWLKQTEEFPDEVKWIKTTLKNRHKVSVKLEDVLSPKEVERMVESCLTIRDKAMISTLFEGGFRPSELLKMQIKSVRFEKQGAYLSVTGKTGDKTVFVYLSAPLLSQWISQHPQNDNPDFYLWISLNPVNHLGIISPGRLLKMIKFVAKRVGIRKRVFSYLLRHSAATDDAKLFPHAVLCSKYGWVPGSSMASVYVHLGAKDVKDAQLRKYGVVKQEDDSIQNIIECNRCRHQCSPGTRFCPVCGLCLKPEISAKLQETEMKKDNEIKELKSDVRDLKVVISGLLQNGQAISQS